MAKHFFYSRKAKVQELDKDGKPIPLVEKVTKLDEAGQPVLVDGVEVQEDMVVPGKFKTVEVVYKDTFNLDKVIRTHTIKQGSIVVLLDDGHEVTEKVQALKDKNKRGPITQKDIIEVKERQWVQSEINLEGADVDRYYEALAAL